jgi:ABC-type xylose transport system permease subunit
MSRVSPEDWYAAAREMAGVSRDCVARAAVFAAGAVGFRWLGEHGSAYAALLGAWVFAVMAGVSWWNADVMHRKAKGNGDGR